VENRQFDPAAEEQACTPLGSKATMAPGILVLDSDQAALEAWSRDLGGLGYKPFATTDPEEARTFLKSELPGLLICDILSLSENGSQPRFSFRDIDPELPLIILTDPATIESAVNALRASSISPGLV
jgi:DNA-binding NtrC family response regulator